MRLVAHAVLGMALLTGSMAAVAQKDPDVGDVQMSHKQTLLENLAKSPIHHRFLGAIQAAGLAESLGANGRVTLFAPTDDAFAKLPAGTLTNLEKPENMEQLKRLVLYHVVSGKLTAKKLTKMTRKGQAATLATLAGVPLTVKRSGSIVTLIDAKGGLAVILTADVHAKDDTMHVIDAVLTPN